MKVYRINSFAKKWNKVKFLSDGDSNLFKGWKNRKKIKNWKKKCVQLFYLYLFQTFWDSKVNTLTHLKPKQINYFMNNRTGKQGDLTHALRVSNMMIPFFQILFRKIQLFVSNWSHCNVYLENVYNFAYQK